MACMEPATGEVKRDCWTVAFGNSFSDTERCVCAGYDNGDIKLFDLRTMSQRWETNVKNGVRILPHIYIHTHTHMHTHTHTHTHTYTHTHRVSFVSLCIVCVNEKEAIL